MKTRITLIATIPVLMLTITGYAQETSATAANTAKANPGAAGAVEVNAVTATAKVTAVDPARRTVTLTNEAGETNTYQLGKECPQL